MRLLSSEKDQRSTSIWPSNVAVANARDTGKEGSGGTGAAASSSTYLA